MVGSQCSFFVTTSVVCVVTSLAFMSEVHATATLELLMERFDNPSSRDAGGDTCDWFSGRHCDHIFRFALDRGNSDNNPKGSFYWVLTTGHFQDQHTIHFGKDMAGVANPIVTPFNTWPPIGVKFKVFVTDKDGWLNPNDDVDSFVQLLRLTPAVNISVANWTSAHMLGRRGSHRTSLTMKHKLYCDDNYYSSDCSVYCVANETYTCDHATGRTICRPGKLCSDGRQPANDVVPRHSASEPSDDKGKSTPGWVYVLIVAALLIVLGVLALVAFLYARRRKAANDRARCSPTTCPTLSASSQSPSSPPPSYSRASATEQQGVQYVTDGAVACDAQSTSAAGAVGFSYIANGVDILTSSKLNQEKLREAECGAASCSSNIYDDDVAPARVYELETNTDASDGTETHL